jgi:hypothetical protein
MSGTQYKPTPQEINALYNYLRIYFDESNPQEIAKQLAEFRNTKLKSGIFVGKVCIPLEGYDGLVGWFRITRESYIKKLPLVPYAFDEKWEVQVRQFSSRSLWKIDKKDWDIAIVRTAWYYAVWLKINSELADKMGTNPENDNYLGVADMTKQEIRKALFDCWNDPKFDNYKAHEVWDASVRSRVYKNALTRSFKDEIWIPFVKYFHLDAAPAGLGTSGDPMTQANNSMFMGNAILGGLFSMGFSGFHGGSDEHVASPSLGRSNSGAITASTALKKRDSRAQLKGSTAAKKQRVAPPKKQAKRVASSEDEAEDIDDDAEAQGDDVNDTDAVAALQDQDGSDASEDQGEPDQDDDEEETQHPAKRTAKRGKGKVTRGGAASRNAKKVSKAKPKPAAKKVKDDKAQSADATTTNGHHPGNSNDEATLAGLLQETGVTTEMAKKESNSAASSQSKDNSLLDEVTKVLEDINDGKASALADSPGNGTPPPSGKQATTASRRGRGFRQNI